MFSGLLAKVTVARRTGYALSRDNALPLSKLLSTVGRRTTAPIYSLIRFGLVAIGVNSLSIGIATRVTGMVSVVLYVTYGGTLIAALIGTIRSRIPEAPAGCTRSVSRPRLACRICLYCAVAWRKARPVRALKPIVLEVE